MKKIILISLVATLVLGATACGIKSSNTKSISNNNVSKTDIDKSETTSNTETNTNSLIDNIDIKNEVQKDGKYMAVFITNKNKTIIDDLELKVNFYDINNKVIDLDEDGHDMLIPDSTVVSRIKVPDNYDHFDTKISVETNIYPSYENHSKDIDLTYNLGNNCVIVQIKNKSNIKIDELEFITLLYSGKTLVSVEYPNDVYNLNSGDTDTEKVSTYGVEYDKAKVYLNQAHTFGSN